MLYTFTAVRDSPVASIFTSCTTSERAYHTFITESGGGALVQQSSHQKELSLFSVLYDCWLKGHTYTRLCRGAHSYRNCDSSTTSNDQSLNSLSSSVFRKQQPTFYYSTFPTQRFFINNFSSSSSSSTSSNYKQPTHRHTSQWTKITWP